MGDDKTIGPFKIDDSFLRHIDRKNRIMDDGTISAQVFSARKGKNEQTLSFTYQEKSLQNEAALKQYQNDKVLNSGDLPGLCRLTFADLTIELKPTLEPRPEPNASDQQYGWLHCVTDLPENDIHMEKMAKLATRNGLVLPFLRK